MSCKWCENIPKDRENLKWPYTIYYYPPMDEFMMTARPYDNGNYLSHERDQFINYCPECGKKLEWKGKKLEWKGDK